MLINISAKCSDTFSMTVYDKDGRWLADADGRVPDFLGEWGDYVRLEIDMETGKICNFDEMKKEFEYWFAEEQEKQAEETEQTEEE